MICLGHVVRLEETWRVWAAFIAIGVVIDPEMPWTVMRDYRAMPWRGYA